MSKLWPTVTKKSPCPICQKADWCALGDRMVKCMRVESMHPCSSGGWYHPYPGDEQSRRYLAVSAQRREIAPAIDAEGMIKMWSRQTDGPMILELAYSLSVSPQSLNLLGACWALKHAAWAFPMRDTEKVVGIRLRSATNKWAVAGSRAGCFIPNQLAPNDRLYVCEGPTSTAALLSAGLWAIGKPNNLSGNEIVKQFVIEKKVREVVIVGDNDQRRQGDRWLTPGMTGAQSLKRDLPCRSVIYAPPCKDVRELGRLVGMGSLKLLIECAIKDAIWTRGL
jgi:hypothetical protein